MMRLVLTICGLALFFYLAQGSIIIVSENADYDDAANEGQGRNTGTSGRAKIIIHKGTTGSQPLIIHGGNKESQSVAGRSGLPVHVNLAGHSGLPVHVNLAGHSGLPVHVNLAGHSGLGGHGSLTGHSGLPHGNVAVHSSLPHGSLTGHSGLPHGNVAVHSGLPHGNVVVHSSLAGHTGIPQGNVAVHSSLAGHSGLPHGNVAVHSNLAGHSGLPHGNVAVHSNLAGHTGIPQGNVAVHSSLAGHSGLPNGNVAVHSSLAGHSGLPNGNVAVHSNLAGHSGLPHGNVAVHSNLAGHSGLPHGNVAVHSSLAGHSGLPHGNVAVHSSLAGYPGLPHGNVGSQSNVLGHGNIPRRSPVLGYGSLTGHTGLLGNSGLPGYVNLAGHSGVLGHGNLEGHHRVVGGSVSTDAQLVRVPLVTHVPVVKHLPMVKQMKIVKQVPMVKHIPMLVQPNVGAVGIGGHGHIIGYGPGGIFKHQGVTGLGYFGEVIELRGNPHFGGFNVGSGSSRLIRIPIVTHVPLVKYVHTVKHVKVVKHVPVVERVTMLAKAINSAGKPDRHNDKHGEREAENQRKRGGSSVHGNEFNENVGKHEDKFGGQSSGFSEHDGGRLGDHESVRGEDERQGVGHNKHRPGGHGSRLSDHKVVGGEGAQGSGHNRDRHGEPGIHGGEASRHGEDRHVSGTPETLDIETAKGRNTDHRSGPSGHEGYGYNTQKFGGGYSDGPRGHEREHWVGHDEYERGEHSGGSGGYDRKRHGRNGNRIRGHTVEYRDHERDHGVGHDEHECSEHSGESYGYDGKQEGRNRNRLRGHTVGSRGHEREHGVGHDEHERDENSGGSGAYDGKQEGRNRSRRRGHTAGPSNDERGHKGQYGKKYGDRLSRNEAKQKDYRSRTASDEQVGGGLRELYNGKRGSEQEDKVGSRSNGIDGIHGHNGSPHENERGHGNAHNVPEFGGYVGVPFGHEERQEGKHKFGEQEGRDLEVQRSTVSGQGGNSDGDVGRYVQGHISGTNRHSGLPYEDERNGDTRHTQGFSGHDGMAWEHTEGHEERYRHDFGALEIKGQEGQSGTVGREDDEGNGHEGQLRESLENRSPGHSGQPYQNERENAATLNGHDGVPYGHDGVPYGHEKGQKGDRRLVFITRKGNHQKDERRTLGGHSDGQDKHGAEEKEISKKGHEEKYRESLENGSPELSGQPYQHERENADTHNVHGVGGPDGVPFGYEKGKEGGHRLEFITPKRNDQEDERRTLGGHSDGQDKYGSEEKELRKGHEGKYRESLENGSPELSGQPYPHERENADTHNVHGVGGPDGVPFGYEKGKEGGHRLEFITPKRNDQEDERRMLGGHSDGQDKHGSEEKELPKGHEEKYRESLENASPEHNSQPYQHERENADTHNVHGFGGHDEVPYGYEKGQDGGHRLEFITPKGNDQEDERRTLGGHSDEQNKYGAEQKELRKGHEESLENGSPGYSGQPYQHERENADVHNVHGFGGYDEVPYGYEKGQDGGHRLEFITPKGNDQDDERRMLGGHSDDQDKYGAKQKEMRKGKRGEGNEEKHRKGHVSEQEGKYRESLENRIPGHSGHPYQHEGENEATHNVHGFDGHDGVPYGHEKGQGGHRYEYSTRKGNAEEDDRRTLGGHSDEQDKYGPKQKELRKGKRREGSEEIHRKGRGNVIRGPGDSSREHEEENECRDESGRSCKFKGEEKHQEGPLGGYGDEHVEGRARHE